MADWSHLPHELLDLISKNLNSDTDLIKFRSVCTSWRSSITPLTSRFPILPNTGISDTTWGFYLSKRTIFRITRPDPDQENDQPWLIKVQKDNPSKTHLLNPLTSHEFHTLLPNWPRSLDLLNFRVLELGQEYALQYISYRPNANSIGDSVTLYMEKVAFCFDGVIGFVLLTIHVSGKLALLKYGDKKWNIINDMPSPYDDVIFYDKGFYAVDSSGRTVVVDVEEMSLRVVAGSVFGGDKKFLVESLGELFMVDKYLSVGPDNYEYDDENYEFYEDFDCFMSERTVKLEVYKMDREGEKWVAVKDLGDRMLFLGDNCGFSASAKDFPGCKGNCVFFTGQSREDDGAMKSRGVSVFDLETGNIGAIPNNSGYSQLFWPPPAWLHPNLAALEDGLDRLKI